MYLDRPGVNTLKKKLEVRQKYMFAYLKMI